MGEARARLLEIMSKIPNAPQKGSPYTTRYLESFRGAPPVDDRGVSWYATMYQRSKNDHSHQCTCEDCMKALVEIYGNLPDYPEDDASL